MKQVQFLPQGAVGVMALIGIFGVLKTHTIYKSSNAAGHSYLSTLAPYLLAIIAIIVLYLLINTVYKNSRNKIVKTIRHFSAQKFWNILLSAISVYFLYDIVFNFHNIEIAGSSFYFIAYTLWHLFFIFLGALLSVIFWDRNFLQALSKANVIYWLIARQNNALKVLNGTAYAVFIAYALTFLLTIGMPTMTSGKVIDTYIETSSFSAGRPANVRFVARRVVKIDNGKTQKTFVLTDKEGLKCNWDNTITTSLRHNILWYSAVWTNKILDCR